MTDEQRLEREKPLEPITHTERIEELLAQLDTARQQLADTQEDFRIWREHMAVAEKREAELRQQLADQNTLWDIQNEVCKQIEQSEHAKERRISELKDLLAAAEKREAELRQQLADSLNIQKAEKKILIAEIEKRQVAEKREARLRTWINANHHRHNGQIRIEVGELSVYDDPRSAYDTLAALADGAQEPTK